MAEAHPYRSRVVRLQQSLEAHDLDLLLTLRAADVSYLTGFFFAQTERPAGIAVPRQGEPVLLLPLLDIDQAAAECWVEDVRTYPEFPGLHPPIAWMGEQLASIAPRGRIGVAGGPLGGGDQALLAAALPQTTLVPAPDLLGALRQIKGPEELAAIRAAAHYADRCQEVGVELLHGRQAGTEYELLVAIQARVQAEMVRERRDLAAARGLVSGAVVSGPKTAFPHGFTAQRTLRSGEAVMLSFGTTVDGYRAENTRTYWLGAMEPRARELDQAVAAAQAAGRAMVAPGTRCCDVDDDATKQLRTAGFGGLLRHRIGHGIGLEGHESPWLESGDPTPLAAHMVVSVEPGLYQAGYAGFLIADTVLVTEDGSTSLTNSPRAAAETPIVW